MNIHLNKLSLRAAVVASRSITASLLEVSDRGFVTRHLSRFSSIEGLSAV